MPGLASNGSRMRNTADPPPATASPQRTAWFVEVTPEPRFVSASATRRPA